MKSLLPTAARCLLVVAALISGYLTWLAFTAGGVTGCADGSACDQVLTSSWSMALGLPVAFFGVIVYLAAAVLGIARGRLVAARLGLLLLIPAAAVWFIGVQAIAIGGFCPWCCAAHLAATAGAILLLTQSRVPAARQWSFAGAAAIALIAALAGIQIAQSEGGIPAVAGSVVDVYDLDSGQAESDDYLREVSLLDGLVTFDLKEMPLTGVSRPQKAVIALTDYTCPHCRNLHDVLQDVAASLGGDVAILKLPATREGTESAGVHRSMLALWKVSPDVHWAVERSLIEGRIAATSQSVVAEATRLVGANRFAEANVRHNDWITEQIRKTRQLQDANRERTGKGTLPQVMIGSELVMGAHSDPEFYLGMIEAQLGSVKMARAVAQQKPPRRIKLKNGGVHIGAVAPGSTVPFSVDFDNNSREPLEISWLNMGPDIALEKFSRDEIFPDDSAEVIFKLKVPADARFGQLERQVSINTSTGHPPISFRVTASVGAAVAQLTTDDANE